MMRLLTMIPMKLMLLSITILGLFYTTQTINAQEATDKSYNLLVGTYTGSEERNGIYVFSFNSETGRFDSKTEVGGITNPSFLVVTEDGKYVYAVSEVGKGQGSVKAYSFDSQSGNLTYLNASSSGGDGPCYLSVDKKNKFVFSGNYGAGSLAAIPIKSDGSLGQDIQAIKHQGSSIHKNQNKPHVHATVLSDDNKFLFVPDLGTDKINIYQVDVTKSNPLTPAIPSSISVKPGSGPRHFTLHPGRKYAYVIQELNGVVTAFDYDKGNLKVIQSVDATPTGYTGNPSAADIHISPDGKFLYTSLRSDINELVIYKVGKNGKLTYVARQSTLGKTPRNFAIDPTGGYLLVGNSRSDQIVIFKRDQQTGLLTDTGQRISVHSPVCLKFTTID